MAIKLMIRKAMPLPFRSVCELGISWKITNNVFVDRHANTISNPKANATPAHFEPGV